VSTEDAATTQNYFFQLCESADLGEGWVNCETKIKREGATARFRTNCLFVDEAEDKEYSGGGGGVWGDERLILHYLHNPRRKNKKKKEINDLLYIRSSSASLISLSPSSS